MSSYITEHDAIVETMQRYVDGGRAGRSELMRPGFHPDATLVGYYPGGLLTGPIQQLFDWIDGNGPAPDIEPRFASIEVLDTIAVVRLEVENWSGELADIAAAEAAFPRYRLEPEDILAEGDKVVVRFTYTGTHQGEFLGVQPTGREVSFAGIIIYRIAHGTIAQHWMQLDAPSLMQQLTGEAPAAART